MNEGLRKDLEGSGCGPVEQPPDIYFEGMSKTTKTLRVASVLAKIRIENLKN
jgi:hypothetical protein